MTPPPIPPPAGYLVFYGQVSPSGGIAYRGADGRGIPLGRVDCRKWVFTWDGCDQWVTPTYIPTGEHWVAVPLRGDA